MLLPAYKCKGFDSECKDEMQWHPGDGHVPRGFLGATGQLSDVELVLIMAEPGNPYEAKLGDPYPDESYSEGPLKEILNEVSEYAYECFKYPRDRPHRNVGYILEQCWPELEFADRMRRTWITESVLCSPHKRAAGQHSPLIPNEGGKVSEPVWSRCVDSYLKMQLSSLPGATIAFLGAKYKDRAAKLAESLGREFIYALHPSHRETTEAGRVSWKPIVDEVRRKRR